MTAVLGNLMMNLGPREDRGVFLDPVVVYVLVRVWLESVIQLNTSSSELAP